MVGSRVDGAAAVWSRRRLGVKLDGDAAVSARLGERRSGRMPGWAQMPDRAGAAGRVLAGQAGPGGCQVGAVVAGEEATSNKIGL